MGSVQDVLRKLVVCICAVAGFLAVAPPAGAAELHVATAYSADNFQTRNLQQYAEDIARVTRGTLRLTVHPAGTLLKPADIFQGVQDGRADAGEVILSSLAREIPLFGMDALPFIVSSYDDARRMWAATRPAIERELAQRGLQLLYAVPWPPQNLYARQPVNGIQGFKGLRMRTYNPASERIAELVGARPVPIQVVDLSRAIADERFDLMLTSSWTGVETRVWHRMQNYYKVNAWIPKNIVFISKKTFDGFEPALRRHLQQQAVIAEERGWRISRESDRQFEEQLAANRVAVSQIDPLMRQYLDRIGENLAREWLKQAGSEELQLLLKYTSERSVLTTSKSEF
jgi:TRAP-type transport system periplasmic protein